MSMMGPHSSENPVLDRPYYREIRPRTLLADYVQCYWVITASSRVHSAIMNRVLPDGCIDIIFNLGDPLCQVNQDSSVGDVPQNCVVGAMRQPIVARLTGYVEIVGVRFKPGGARPFFRLPLHELTDHLVALDDLWNPTGATIEFQTAEGATIAQKIALLEHLLAKRIEAIPHADNIVRKAISVICDTKGQVAINHLGELLGISSRQLERKFNEQVGLSPKSFCRVIRIQNAISMLQRQPEPKWTEITYAGGFYDQAHFIREFKAISGLTPSAYVNEQTRVGFVQYITQDM